MLEVDLVDGFYGWAFKLLVFTLNYALFFQLIVEIAELFEGRFWNIERCVLRNRLFHVLAEKLTRVYWKLDTRRLVLLCGTEEENGSKECLAK